MNAELEKYRRDGYAIFRNVLDRELIAEADAHVDWLMKKHPELRPEQLGNWLVAKDPFWTRLISDDRLLDIAEQFVGPNIGLFASHYICKPPRVGQPVLWHQDGAYWPLEPMEVVTLWLAVSDAQPDNGGMRVIPRTQDMDIKQLRQRKDVENVLDSEMDGDVDESGAVDIVLQPGDVEVHNPNIVHGSNANTSDRWRKGLTIRYIPTSTRILQPDSEWPIWPMLMRGQAVPGINDYVPYPSYIEGEHMPFRDSHRYAAPSVTSD